MCGECDYPSVPKVRTITILEMQTKNMVRLEDRKKELEEHIKNGKPFQHRRDRYIIHSVSTFDSHPKTKQLYFVGELVTKDDSRH